MKKTFLLIVMMVSIYLPMNAQSAVKHFSGTWNTTEIGGFATPMGGSWAFDFDESLVQGVGRETFDNIPLIQLDWAVNNYGSFNVSNSTGSVFYEDGVVTAVYVGGGRATNLSSGTIDFFVEYEPCGPPTRAVYVNGGLGSSSWYLEGTCICLENYPPIASAGNDQSIHIGTTATLDGSDSSDPDENYPLTYSWQIVGKPIGSLAVLNDPTSVSPSFNLDVGGEYTAELIVTDSLGLSGSPDQVIISTFNTSPVADAGLDQEIGLIGEMVNLDGSQSYDDDGDSISYEWILTNKPEESLAELSDPNSVNPSFYADKNGDYQAQLVVSDLWDVSDPDTVTISFNNVAPVAVAGSNQSLVQDKTVYLDGSGSFDVNGDILTYNWSIVSKPDGSIASIATSESVTTNFTVDEPGEYIVSLVVNDGILGSEPDNIVVGVISYSNAVTNKIDESYNYIVSLPPISFKNKAAEDWFTKKLIAAKGKIDTGDYIGALDDLTNVLIKTDGCATDGSPDPEDKLKNCEDQDVVYPIIIDALDLLSNLL